MPVSNLVANQDYDPPAHRLGGRSFQIVELPGRCPICGGPRGTFATDDYDRKALNRRVEAGRAIGEVYCCTDCIQRLLIRLTIAKHGHVGDPWSSHNPGHDARMEAHALRVALHIPLELTAVGVVG